MLTIPDLTAADVAFGGIKHMPRYSDVPENFKKSYDPFCKAISSWFFSGAKGIPNGLAIDGVEFTAKPGVDSGKALRAIKAVLGSFEPKHEHKEAACAYMLSEWFDMAKQKAKA